MVLCYFVGFGYLAQLLGEPPRTGVVPKVGDLVCQGDRMLFRVFLWPPLGFGVEIGGCRIGANL